MQAADRLALDAARAHPIRASRANRLATVRVKGANRAAPSRHVRVIRKLRALTMSGSVKTHVVLG